MTEVTTHRSDTRDRILGAAAAILRESGPAALTTRAVAQAAGVQAPAIYRLFGDKDGLLEAVAELVMATHTAAKASVVTEARDADVDPLDDLRAGWDAHVDFGLSNPTIFGLLSDPARAGRSPAAQAGWEVLRARIHRVALTGRLRVGEERAAELVHAAGTGTVQTLLARPPEERDPAVPGEMYEAVLRQVLTDPAAPAHDDPRATVVAFRALAPRLDVLTGAERALLTDWLDRVIAAP